MVTQYKAKILVAEDNRTNREVSLAILENIGILADAVANGEEALQALQAIQYDLVLMDCQMPGLDGFAATRLIRDPGSSVQDHHIPVIAMTANTDTSGQAECLACGMNDFLAKPLLPEQLEAILKKWLPPLYRAERKTEPEPGESAGTGSHDTLIPIWDQEGMHSRLMGDKHVAFIVCQGFLQDMPQQLDKLEDCYRNGDLPGLRQQAHTIKGAAAVVGGRRLWSVAHTLEELEETQAALIEPAVAQIVREFDCLQETMSKYLASLKES
nr:response regulator [uncultured Desulfobulbus sp.]